jgi:hypothetical protein
LDRIKLVLGIALVAMSTGCVGFVDGDYGGGGWWEGPDVFFGGGYERGHDVRGYSSRGAASRHAAHPGGGGHAGGGGHGGGGRR